MHGCRQGALWAGVVHHSSKSRIGHFQRARQPPPAEWSLLHCQNKPVYRWTLGGSRPLLMHLLTAFDLSCSRGERSPVFRKQFSEVEDACALAQAMVDTVREPLIVLDR